MTETANLSLTLLEEAQAQKHVTVNEALVRIDALAGGRVESAGATAPPPAPAEGEAHIVGTGATGDWAGEDGRIAIRINGGWAFATPRAGQAFWDAGAGVRRQFDGGAWQVSPVATARRGAATLARVIEADHVLASGAISTTDPLIPDKAMVLGVTGRVDVAITGASSWQLGVSGSPDRYGAGIGTAEGSFIHGVTGWPTAYFGATSLLLTAIGGDFAGGQIRLAVHVLEVVPPSAA
jgi:hypothetical protein